MKKIFLLLCTVMALFLSSCSITAPKSTPTPAPTSAPTATSAAAKSLEELTQNKEYITITVSINGTDKVMSGELYPDLAPETVANFNKLVADGFYNGLIFHRVISGFMIQGGGYDENMTEKESPYGEIKGEFDSNGFENPLKHTRGVLSMARTSIPDSATSQFFIMHEDYPYLDGEYAAFGKITEGLDVVDEIAASATTSLSNGMTDVPESAIVIKDISIITE